MRKLLLIALLILSSTTFAASVRCYFPNNTGLSWDNVQYERHVYDDTTFTFTQSNGVKVTVGVTNCVVFEGDKL